MEGTVVFKGGGGVNPSERANEVREVLAEMAPVHEKVGKLVYKLDVANTDQACLVFNIGVLMGMSARLADHMSPEMLGEMKALEAVATAAEAYKRNIVTGCFGKPADLETADPYRDREIMFNALRDLDRTRCQ